MTAREVFDKALALLPTNTEEDDSLEQYAVRWLELVLLEMQAAQNSILAARGETERDGPACIESLDAQMPCDEALLPAAVYLLAAVICKDDDDAAFSNLYRSRGMQLIYEAAKAVPTAVRDVYWGTGE